jgi:hypothetical protein
MTAEIGDLVCMASGGNALSLSKDSVAEDGRWKMEDERWNRCARARRTAKAVI